MRKTPKNIAYDLLHERLGKELQTSSWSIYQYRSQRLGKKLSNSEIIKKMERDIDRKNEMIKEILGYINRSQEVIRLCKEFNEITQEYILTEDIDFSSDRGVADHAKRNGT